MSGLSTEDMDKLKKCFDEMGAKPKMDTAEDLQDWMVRFLDSKGKLPIKAEEVVEEEGEGDDTDSSGKATGDRKATSERIGYVQPPRVASFSGDETSKGDTTYDLWKFEVECLQEADLHSVGTITQAARKSLKGEAARIVKRLGTGASLSTILKKMEDVYGVVDTGETLLAEFYGARQGKSEDVTAWGCRLEDLLDRAMEHKSVPINDVNEMLRSRFWNGLNQKLKDGSRHKFDTLTDFDKLRKEIRAIEKEHQLTDQFETSQQRKAQAKMTTASVDESDSFKKLESVVSQLSKQVEAMQQYAVGRGQGVSGQGATPQRGGWQGGRGQGGPRQGNPVGQPGVQPQPGLQPPVAGNPHPQQFPPQQPRPSQDARQQGCFKCGELGHYRQECPRRFEPTCWQCGRLGHRHQNCTALNF